MVEISLRNHDHKRDTGPEDHLDRARGLALTMGGIVVGVVLAMMAARAITTLFYGFQPDVVTAVAVASVVLAGVASFACLVPARRASRIDPIVALSQ